MSPFILTTWKIAPTTIPFVFHRSLIVLWTIRNSILESDWGRFKTNLWESDRWHILVHLFYSTLKTREKPEAIKLSSSVNSTSDFISLHVAIGLTEMAAVNQACIKQYISLFSLPVHPSRESVCVCACIEYTGWVQRLGNATMKIATWVGGVTVYDLSSESLICFMIIVSFCLWIWMSVHVGLYA